MKILLWAWVRGIQNRIRSARPAEILKFALLGSVAAVFLSLLGWGFLRFLRATDQVPFIGTLLTHKLIAMVLLSLLFLVAISGLVAATAALYGGRDLPFLLTTPLPPRAVFCWKAILAAGYASWMVVLVVLPFTLALARVRALSADFYLWAALALSAFLLGSALAGVLAAAGLMTLFPGKKIRSVILIAAAFGGAALTGIVRWLEPERLTRPDELMAIAQYLAQLQAPTSLWLPSTWATQALVSWMERRFVDAAAWLVLELGFLAVLVAALAALGRRYLSGFWAFAGAGGKAARLAPVAFAPRPRIWAIARKDFLIFVRDPVQWAQAILLAGILFVYLFSFRRLPLDTPALRNLGGFLNFAAAGFVLAAVSLRFCYPAFSLEGRAAWAVRASPASPLEWLIAKCVSSGLPVFAISAILFPLSAQVLKVEGFFWKLNLFGGALLTVALVGAGVGMGALFPRLKVENVAQIESSPGGILFAAAALFWVGLSTSLLAAPAWSQLMRAKILFAWPLWSFAGLQLLALIGSLWLAAKKLAARDLG